MTHRGPSRTRDTRRRWWPVFVMCLLALAASAHFYALYVTKTAAARSALEASRESHVALAGVEHGILVAEYTQKSLKARVTADQTRFSDELYGIPGPGVSGIPAWAQWRAMT